MLELKIDLSFSPKRVLPNSCIFLGLYLLIYIEHKGIIEFLSNELTKANEKIEPCAHS